MRLPPFANLSRRPTSRIIPLYALLVAANVLAWGWAWIAFRDRPVLLGTAFLAYAFGLRHAFDADHIAAIDNVVRKMMQERRQADTVGFFFSLGHSTVVVLASLVIAAAASSIDGGLDSVHEAGSVIGTVLSASFLLAVGVANLFVLKGVVAAFARVRRGGDLVEEDLDALMAGHGLLARIFRPLFGAVSRAWHMYPIGFLFGLGFDTASEVGLLGISATQAAQGASFGDVMIFPVLFTAGMSLMDTTDSILMTRVYGWAFINPVRKLWYNMTLTACSIVIAIFIGSIEALGLIADKFSLQGTFWTIIGRLNDNFGYVGLSVVGLFVFAWLVSIAIYNAKRYDEGWRPSNL